MLSTSVIKNVSQASHYYGQKDNYYTRDEGIEQSEWWGKGAKQLQLSGQVDEKKFTELLQGKIPNGEQLGKMVDGEIKHRAGWDLTFSAPKSISLMVYLGGDTRLLAAHRQAVAVALTSIERSAAQARVKTAEGIGYQNTGNLVAALYHHDLSRAKDPQMHTHAVVMNMTQRFDGVWRSLASQIGRYDGNVQGEVNGFIERVRHFNRYLSKIYETELAYQVKQLGYEITTDTKSGIFEIIGVTPKAIQLFSKRRNQIEGKLAEKGLSGGKAAAMATLDKRPIKETVDREKLKTEWEQEAKTIGLDCQKIIDQAYLKQTSISDTQEKTKIVRPEIATALQQAAKSLSVFQTTFTLEEFMMEASSYAIRESFNIESLFDGIDDQIAKGHLIKLVHGNGKTTLMAQSTLEDEKRLNTQLLNNQLSKELIDSNSLTHFLTQQEEVPVKLHAHLVDIFTHDRIKLIEGEAAKEALIQPIIKIAKSADLEVVVLSPSLVGSRQFAKSIKQAPSNIWERIKEVFIDSTPKHYSVMQFLSQYGNEKVVSVKSPDILIVDNAHLLSTHQKANLTEWNTAHQTKLILLGNQASLLPQQLGTSLQQLAEYIKPISIPKNQISTSALNNDSIHDAVIKNAHRIVEVTNQEDRHVAMANHYAHISEGERQQSWLVGQNKQAVDVLNTLTHEALVAKDKVTQVNRLTVLQPVFLAEGKAVLAKFYQQGQVIRFNDTYTSLSITRGDYLRVVEKNEKLNRVILQKENGQKILWQPERIAGTTTGKIELFNEKQCAIGIGESLVLQRSIKSKQMVKGERLAVTDMRGQKIKLKASDGKAIVLDLAKPYHRHIDYGYAATAHAIHHEKPVVLISELKPQSLQTDQRRFNQIITQPKEAWIYTDDCKHLINQLEKKTGDRLSAHDTLKKADEIKKNLNSIYDVLEKQLLSKQGEKGKTTITKQAVDAIDYAMRHLAEREAGFSHKDLIHVAMQHAFGEVTQSMLNQATIEMEKAGILIRGNRGDGTLWTTLEAVKIEREILALAIKDKGKFEPIASDTLLRKHCDSTTLRPEQIAAIKAITQNTDRVLSIQGRAGTGKTTMMMKLADVLSAKELLTEGGYALQGIAPTHKAVKELRARGIKAQTVDSFLLDMKRIAERKQSHDFSRTLLVVDEASMVSNRKMLAVLQVGHDFNFREIIPTGDTEQNPAIESGKPHDLIQRKLKHSTIVLKDIQRQNDPILKEAVKEIYRNDVKQTFSILKDFIIEMNSNNAKDPLDSGLDFKALQQKYYQKRIEAIASDYVALLMKGEDVQVIAPSHKDRKAVNEEVRNQLDKLGFLKGNDHSFSVLSSKDMTGVERSEAKNFKPGQIVRFNLSVNKMIKAGDYFAIKSINKEHNILTLTNDHHKEIIWQVPRSIERMNNTVEVFNQENRRLKVGDKIVWVRTDRKEAIVSTEFAKVTDISQQSITVTRPDNSVLTFDGQDKKYQHWDHAHAITTYGSQGGTYSTILALFESSRQKLMNLKTLLVTITRPKDHLRIYTDDKEKLQAAISRNAGNKVSSLEVVGAYPSNQNKNLEMKISQTQNHSLGNLVKNSHHLANKEMHHAAIDELILHYQNIVKHEKISHAAMANNINHQQQVQPISDKVITEFLRESHKKSYQTDIKNLDAYKAMLPRHEQYEIPKVLSKTKDFEHEL